MTIYSPQISTSPWYPQTSWLLVGSEKQREVDHQFKCSSNIHSLKLTWHLKIGLPKRKFIFQPPIFRRYVSFREGMFFSKHIILRLERFINLKLKESTSPQPKSIRIWSAQKMILECPHEPVAKLRSPC